jgi:diguanylate cyclase (GGDEF)-like protein/PAS domain S-box-containing protein
MNEKNQELILIVNDIPQSLLLLVRILINQGYLVVMAQPGASALQVARDIRPDLILLDINMLEMSGFAVAKELRNDEDTRGIPIVFISSLDKIEDTINAFHAGGADYIFNPFEVKEVLTRIKTHLYIHNQQTRLELANRELAARVEELTRSQELLKHNENKLRAFVDALPNLSFVYDEQGRYLEVLANEETLLAARVDVLLNHRIDEILPPAAAGIILSAIRQVVESGVTQAVEYTLPVLSGEERWFEAHITLMEKEETGHAKVLMVANDITERVRLFHEVQKLANLDPLTGCYNRRHFMKSAEQEIRRALRYKRPLSLMMLDIDKFKESNDCFGHQTGDLILCSLVSLCQQNLRADDLFGRYGGEEFIALMPEISLHQAESAARRLQSKIRLLQVDTPSGKVSITVSIGIASLDTRHNTMDALISGADKALYAAKVAGRNCVWTGKS